MRFSELGLGLFVAICIVISTAFWGVTVAHSAVTINGVTVDADVAITLRGKAPVDVQVPTPEPTPETVKADCGPVVGIDVKPSITLDGMPPTRVDLNGTFNSYPFVTDKVPGRHGMFHITGLAVGQGIFKEMWISECPGGKVYKGSVDNCRTVADGGGSIAWRFHGLKFFECKLPLNTQLYLNLRDLTCDGEGKCGVLLSNQLSLVE